MLVEKKIGKYTVREAGMREAVRKIRMMEQAAEYAGDDAELKTTLAIYPHVFGCVIPHVSVDEFLELKETEIDTLYLAALELNPHWFALPDQEKKTDQQLSESTNG